MSMFDGPDYMLEEAAKQGIITIKNVNLEINNITVKINQQVSVKDNDRWTNFLTNVVEHSDSDSEVSFASMFLQVTQKMLHVKPAITDADVSTLTKSLESCETIDDILRIIDDKKSEIPLTMRKRSVQSSIHWKKPVVINNKCRYYSYNTDWYIERQDKLNSNGGQSYFYSLFNAENKEIARYDKIKQAKNDAINIIKSFT
jgi:hypothetical protein